MSVSPSSTWMSFGGNAQLLGQDLRVRRLVPLALRLGAEARDRLAGRVNADLAAVEHLDAEDVEVLRRAGADDLGEARDADAHQLAALRASRPARAAARRSRSCSMAISQRARVVAAVVLPAERRLVRELLRLDEVLQPELGRIHAELVRHDVDHALDRVHGFGHPERAAVGDAARRLVRVDAVDLDVRGLQVVRPGADVEEPGRELGRIRRRVGVAVVGEVLMRSAVSVPSFFAASSAVMW